MSGAGDGGLNWSHVMGWVVRCGDSNIFFGPPPNSKDDLFYLTQKMRIAFIVSLKPKTGRLTREIKWVELSDSRARYDTSVWYRKLDPEMAGGILPLDGGEISAMTDAEQVQLYITLAKQIRSELGTKKAECVFVHYKDGFSHEVYIAMALWRLEAGLHAPKDPVEWLKSNDHHQALKMATEQEMMLKVWAEATKRATGIGAMFRTQKKKRKTK